MRASERYRYRIRFSKRGALRYVGHLDLQRAWERLIRRAALPLAYSKGYHPRPRMQFAAALPLGMYSEAELIDAWFDLELDAADLQRRLEKAAPPGMAISDVRRVETRGPSLPALVIAADFELLIDDPPADLDARVEALLCAEHIERERRGKPYDLRLLVETIAHDETCSNRLLLRLTAKEGATGRADEVIDCLGLVGTTVRATRIRLHLRSTRTS